MLQWLEKTFGNFDYPRLAVEEYIFMTALVFVLTQIFKKRHDHLKRENELTI